MYTIISLYLETIGQLTQAIDTNIYTPEEFRQLANLSIRQYMKVFKDERYIVVDLSLMFMETKLGKFNTWSEIEAYLTDELVLGYAIDFYTEAEQNSRIKNQLTTIDALSTFSSGKEWLELAYVNINSPTIRNKQYKFFDMPDLVLTKVVTFDDTYLPSMDKSILKTLDFTQCIPIVNGRFCRSIIDQDKDELYIRDGSKLCRNTYPALNLHPDILLLDTHRLNGHTIVPLSDCSIVSNKQVNTDATDYNSLVTVTLPASVNFTKVTPWLVLDGVPYFNTELNLFTNNSFQFYPNRTLLRTSKIHTQWLMNQSLPNTEIYEVDATLNDIFLDECTNEQSSSFVILFNVPSIHINEKICTNFLNYQALICENFNHGLLLKNNIHAFKSYTYHQLANDSAILYMKDSGEFYLVDEDDESVAFNGLGGFRSVKNEVTNTVSHDHVLGQSIDTFSQLWNHQTFCNPTGRGLHRSLYIPDIADSSYRLLSFTTDKIFV
jgi:hypothetical protein